MCIVDIHTCTVRNFSLKNYSFRKITVKNGSLTNVNLKIKVYSKQITVLTKLKLCRLGPKVEPETGRGNGAGSIHRGSGSETLLYIAVLNTYSIYSLACAD